MNWKDVIPEAYMDCMNCVHLGDEEKSEDNAGQCKGCWNCDGEDPEENHFEPDDLALEECKSCRNCANRHTELCCHCRRNPNQPDYWADIDG